MGLINFLVDIVRKLIILFLSAIALGLLAFFVLKFPGMDEAAKKVMMWVMVAPMFLISLLVKK